ncbi:DUF393 domain-containing protein, partial [bacterium]|nr:DUF393 domain-containing protein [bacterium]
MNSTQQPIVFFDGVCGLCNRLVDFLLKQDRSGKLLFAPLQGETAAQLLDSKHIKNLNTVAVWVNGKVYTHSDGILAIVPFLPFYWQPLLIGKLIPRPWRDFLYNYISRKRYQWFGKKTTCRMPQPHEKARFLD